MNMTIEYARAVAAALPGEWRVLDDEALWYRAICSADGLRVALITTRKRCRITAAGTCEDDFVRQHLYECLEISAAGTATPGRLAREIERRLLPGLVPAVAAAVKQAQAERAHLDGKAATLRRMAVVTGGEVVEEQDYVRAYDINITCKVHKPGAVTVIFEDVDEAMADRLILVRKELTR